MTERVEGSAVDVLKMVNQGPKAHVKGRLEEEDYGRKDKQSY